MSEKSCKECVFYKNKTITGASMGMCDYPLPPFVRMNSAGGFIYERDAIECPLYKPLTEVMDKEVSELTKEIK